MLAVRRRDGVLISRRVGVLVKKSGIDVLMVRRMVGVLVVKKRRKLVEGFRGTFYSSLIESKHLEDSLSPSQREPNMPIMPHFGDVISYNLLFA